MLNKKTLQKGISAVTMFATVITLSGVSMLAPLTASAATIVDGSLISSNATNSDGTPTLASLDIYIVKIVGTKKFKRLVLNPQVFASYGHLKWSDIQEVDQATVDSYETSSLARVDGDDKVYALTPDGDTGAKSWINLTAEQFIEDADSDADSIYTINSVDGSNYKTGSAITTVSELKDFYKDGSLPETATDGALKISLSSDTADSANIPLGVGVEFAKFNLTASDEGDVTIDSVKLTAGGLDDSDYINDIAVYDEDGNRLNSSLRSMSGDEASINLNNFVVEAGETETITVKASVYEDGDSDDPVAEGIYAIGIKSADDVSSDATKITGSFPMEGNEMNAVLASGIATLNFNEDGSSLSSVDLGAKAATLAKFKVTGDDADATIYRISLKRDNGVSGSSAADDDFENLVLYADGKKVAEADEISNKYVSFNIEDGVKVEDGDTVKFVMKGDVIDGAGKTAGFSLDNAVDVEAMGTKYPAMTIDNYDTQEVDIEAGAVTLEKVNADPLKVKVDTDNVELGTIKITASSGEAVNIESLKLSIATTGDDNAGVASAFDDLTDVEIYDATDKSTYDLTYSSGTGTKVYQNTDINIEMESGETHELIVRGDTSADADGVSYTVSMTSGQLTIKEVEDDTALTDITPSTITLKKVEVEASGIGFTIKTLSAAKNAVVGTEDVEAIRFDINATAADATVTELSFDGSLAATALSSSLVSGFSLYESGNTTPIAEVGASSLDGEIITFDDLAIKVSADTSKTFYVTVDLVSDSANANKTIKLQISSYAAEDADDDIYDTTHDTDSDGDIEVALASARTITIVGEGSLAVSIDNTLSATKRDLYAVAGVTPSTGITSDVLAALKLKATNEDVEVTQIKVDISSVGSVANIFSRLYLVDEKGTQISDSATMGATVTFEDFTYTVSGEKYLYLKGVTNPIGEDEVGVLNDTAITFSFDSVEANGASSGSDLATSDADSSIEAGEIVYDEDGDGIFDEAAEDSTLASKSTGVLASRISAVELVSSGAGYSVGSTLSSGEQIIGIIKVTTDASSNETSTGTAVKTALSKVVVDINKLTDAGAGVGTAITASTIQNADSSTTTAGNAILATADGKLTFSVSGSDYEIAPSSTEYFLVKATVSKGTGDDYVQAKLSNLDSTVDGTANFNWKDSSEAATKRPLRLSYASVTGTTLSE